MKTIKLGEYNLLTVTKLVDFGLYLDGGDAEEILLPARYVPEGTKVGDELNVFIYLDQEERPVATTEKPFVKVGEFALLEVAWVNEYGAFLKWGLMKDLFCPFREQKRRMQIGEKHMVYVYIDEESYRIVASAKIEKHLNSDTSHLQPAQEVDLLLWQRTDLGYKVIVNNEYQGLIFLNQVFQRVYLGEHIKGYIANIRQDGKLDISLQLQGRQQTLDFADELLQYLKDHKGHCDLWDKSDAEDIYQCFSVSKKVFKKAVGNLYKKRLISISPQGLDLN